MIRKKGNRWKEYVEELGIKAGMENTLKSEWENSTTQREQALVIDGKSCVGDIEDIEDCTNGI